jgi:hypothetical protein
MGPEFFLQLDARASLARKSQSCSPQMRALAQRRRWDQCRSNVTADRSWAGATVLPSRYGRRVSGWNLVQRRD